MEKFTMENVLWILVGSIATILVTKLFEIFQSSKANKFELQKIYFERKISAAEEAIEDLQNEINGIEDFIRVYEKIPQSDITLLPQLLKELDDSRKDAEKRAKSSKKISNSMYMYFDFDDYLLSDKSNRRKLLDLSLEISKIDYDMEILSSIYQKYEDPQMKGIVFDDLKKRFPQYFPKLEKLVTLGRKAVEEARLQQKKIISEMKSHDFNNRKFIFKRIFKYFMAKKELTFK
ncbi:MAG: hypothetical protein MUO34_06715 [Ignavibacteriaceae bacterium]|nr:hypothetical protein [Ignavibacteriaceae bacterium]